MITEYKFSPVIFQTYKQTLTVDSHSGYPCIYPHKNKNKILFFQYFYYDTFSVDVNTSNNADNGKYTLHAKNISGTHSQFNL